MSDWDVLYLQVEEAQRNEEFDRLNLVLQQSWRRVGRNNRDDWDWFKSALADGERKYFAAAVLSHVSIPRFLLPHLIRAAVYERNVSINRNFVSPAVSTYGPDMVAELLREYLTKGTPEEQTGARNALYWAHYTWVRRTGMAFHEEDSTSGAP